MNVFISYSECKNELLCLLKVIKFLKKERDISHEVYSTLCNGNIIILGTLLESFTENVIQEYIDKITVKFNNRNISYSNLPDGIKEFIGKSILSNHYKKNFESMTHSQALKFINEFMNNMNDGGFIIDNELDGINKLSFGKHGENEIKKTFKRIGIEIENIILVFDDLNNFFNLRNGIIHSESVSLTKTIPPSIEDTRRYLLLLYLYIKVINKHLIEKLQESTSR